MTGIAIAAAGWAPAPPPAGSGPLSCWVTFAPAGTLAFAVSGASGDLAAQGYGIVQSEHSGGVAPFVESLTIEGDASGKLGFVPNGLGADTIGYSGFGLNEVEGGRIKYVVRDGAGTVATARFPATGSISITRTS